MPARILIEEEERQAAPMLRNPVAAWRSIGWFGFLLAAIGTADALTNWFPLAFQSPEWEFATIATTFGSLPLVTMGLAALLGAAFALGNRRGALVMALLLLVLGLVVLGLYALFMTNVPMALQATAGRPGSLPIRRGIMRTSIMGLGFSVGYLAAAVFSLRSLKGGKQP